MNNQMAMQENDNTQLEMTLEGIQKIEVQKNKKRKKLVFPTLLPSSSHEHFRYRNVYSSKSCRPFSG